MTLRILILCLSTMAMTAAVWADTPDHFVSFNRDIRPILSDKCMFCHGPDAATREADLRLDDEKDAHDRVLVAGQPDESELFRRIISTDEDEVMPPHDSGRALSKDEIELIRLWIIQGARYQQHWSFIPPVRPRLPDVANFGKQVNAIDAFVLARLKTENIRPSPEADKPALLRRVSLDLTGLPPTIEELDAFLADASGNAYERAVDRLLESPRFGEQMTRYWLDAARYADTNGFFVDSERSMWRWRDWVIDAFNKNMPFNQFTIEQLAGDLLPDATIDQQIASGFNRNHMITRETGAIDEEYRVEYVVDRLHTTSTIWLGLTVACARCHDHKFDPVSQKEFFSLFAFFNNIPEKGVGRQQGNTEPLLPLPSKELQQQLAESKQSLADMEHKFKASETAFVAAQSEWERHALMSLPTLSGERLLAHFALDGNADNSVAATHEASVSGQVDYEPGLMGTAASFDGDTVIESDAIIDIDRETAFSLSAWVKPTGNRPACIVSKNDDVNKLRGFDLMIRKNKLVIHLIHQWNQNAIGVTTKANLKHRQWQHVMVTYDGCSSAAGIRIYVDGQSQELQIQYDCLSESIQTDQPLRIGRRSTSAPFVGAIDDLRLYQGILTANEVAELFAVQLIEGVAAKPAAKRSEPEQQLLRRHFLAMPESGKFQTLARELEQLRQQYAELQQQVPDVMVMRESQTRRETFVLIRGQYDQPGEKVSPGVPDALAAFPDDFARDRLGLARWLMSDENSLTARVTVNRYWQQLFGTGLVKTAGDFGAQGQWPSHPDLLDWLAVEFREKGWNTKHIMKLLVMSATYRQQSRMTSESIQRDPENRLLARGPRFRMDAETVRDNALAISGLLKNRLGGPSVKPYQPDGIWKAVSYGGDLSYQQGEGDALYRRSLYTYWKRQSPPPALMAFDAPTRETCSVNRPRTNTPMQALVLMNDTTYMEAARVLAERMMKIDSDGPVKRIQFAFRSATARIPSAVETDVLEKTLSRQLDWFRNHEEAALSLASVGESKRDTTLDVKELAAWTTLASMILNLNETITKN